MTMNTDDGEGSTCTFLGNYSQAGRMGTSSGTFSCSTGFSGTFSAFEIEASLSAFTARAQITSGACRWNGRLGGMRRGP